MNLNFPNYEKSILTIPNSILKYYGIETPYSGLPILEKELAKKYKNIILMVFDGMGVDVLENQLSPLSFLRKNLLTEVCSVFPSTTAAAMTTFYSGLSPSVHGWIGWSCYFEECNQIIELFRNKNYYTQELVETVNVDAILNYETIWEKIAQKNKGKIDVCEVLPDFKGGCKTINEHFKKVETFCQKPNQKFIFSYCPRPDHEMHDFGPYSETTYQVLKQINEGARKLMDTIDDSLLIITADHGQIPLQKEIFLEEIPEFEDCLTIPVSLTERTLALFVKEEKKEKLKHIFSQYLADDFILLSQEEVLKEKIFGPEKNHTRLRGFLGDFLMIAKTDKLIRQRVDKTKPDWRGKKKGGHGGITPQECRVPLIVYGKK